MEADGSFDDAAETNCDNLVARALVISPKDPEVRLALASIRMSQQRTDEAKNVVTELYEEIKDKEPCTLHSEYSIQSIPTWR